MSLTKNLKSVIFLHFGSSAEFYHKYYHIVIDIYTKWPRESGLGHDIAIKSEGSWLKLQNPVDTLPRLGTQSFQKGLDEPQAKN